MNRPAGRSALRNWAIALVLALPGPVLAASAPAGPPGTAPPAVDADPDRDEELDEIVVTGAKRVRKPEALIAWLRRLVGQYTYEGYVDVRSDGAPSGRQPVKGVGDCVGFGPAPGVQCVLKVIWPEVHGPEGKEVPGGVSSLAPAMILYGLDPDYLGIRYMQLDNKGLADSGQGYLRGDTLTTKAPCVDIPGNCTRTTQIDAQGDGKVIRMQIDIEKDEQRLVRFMFVQHRLAQQTQPGDAARAPRR